MSKSNRVKRKVQVWERKLRSLESKYHSERLNKSEYEKFKKELEEREEKYYELSVLQKKIELAIKKSKQLDKEFKAKRNEFATTAEFKKALKENRIKRNNVILEIKAEYKKLKLSYCYEFETFSYKMKRWFFGMGKEFSRISWMPMKTVATNFLIIGSIVLLLSTLFFIIDLLFGLFI